jgi:hypothetical protein
MSKVIEKWYKGPRVKKTVVPLETLKPRNLETLEPKIKTK